MGILVLINLLSDMCQNGCNYFQCYTSTSNKAQTLKFIIKQKYINSILHTKI